MIFEPLLNIEMIIFAVPSIGMVPFVGSGRSVHGSIHTEELRKNAVCSGNKNNAVCRNEK
jgi:hypothetical protein